MVFPNASPGERFPWGSCAPGGRMPKGSGLADEMWHVSWWFCTYFAAKLVILMGFFTKTRGTMNFSAVEMMAYPRLTIKNVGLANKKVSTIRRETFCGIWCLIQNIRVNKPDEKWISPSNMGLNWTNMTRESMLKNRDAPIGNVEFRYFNL